MTDKMSLQNVKIESDRLIQIPITMQYAQEIFHEFTDAITKYMYPPTPVILADTASFVKSSILSLNKGTDLQMVVLDKITGEFLGCSGVHNLDRDVPELGIWIRTGAHGQKLGMEAVSALISWAWANLGCEYLAYPVDCRNLPSRMIPETHGGIPVKEWKEMKQNGFELDLVGYRIPRPCR